MSPPDGGQSDHFVAKGKGSIVWRVRFTGRSRSLCQPSHAHTRTHTQTHPFATAACSLSDARSDDLKSRGGSTVNVAIGSTARSGAELGLLGPTHDSSSEGRFPSIGFCSTSCLMSSLGLAVASAPLPRYLHMTAFPARFNPDILSCLRHLRIIPIIPYRWSSFCPFAPFYFFRGNTESTLCILSCIEVHKVVPLVHCTGSKSKTMISFSRI
jgi:hypothetical protein